jgi:alcohol dehydrogenase
VWKTQAVLLLESGRPRPYAQSQPLVVEEVDLQEPGSGEVLVEVQAASLCHSDLSVINGSRPRPLPMVLGHEAAGVVRQLGSGVTGLREGDKVAFALVPSCGRCAACAAGRPTLCLEGARSNAEGRLLGGARRFFWRGQPVNHHVGISGFSQYTVAAQQSLIPIPDAVPAEIAALFSCALVTGIGAVTHAAGVKPGMSVVVFGLGGVGLAAVMGAQLSGAYPIVAVDLQPAKLEAARGLGATHLVDAGQQDAVQAVRDYTGGGAEFAFEAVGSVTVLEQAFAATRRGGTTVTVGLPDPAARLSLPALSFAAEERTLKGSYGGSVSPRQEVPRLLELYLAGRLPAQALVSSRIGLSEINGGFDRLDQALEVRQVVFPSGPG